MIGKGWLLLVVLVLALLPSCRFFRKAAGPEKEARTVLFSEISGSIGDFRPPPHPPVCLFRVMRTGCGGPCPEWEGRFYETGISTIVGKEGPFRAPYSKNELDSLILQARASGIFELPDTIGAWLPNLPGWEIEIRTDSLSRTIRHFYNDPPSLRAFERQLEDWIFSLPWERIQD